VINQEFARRFLAAVSPLGQRVTVSNGPDDLSLEIIGIVRDARISGTSAGSRPEIYIPFPVAPDRGFYLVVQTSGDPLLLAGPVRTIIHSRAPDAVTTNVQTMDQLLQQAVAPQRFHAWLLGMLAGLALVLALAGIYAVSSYSVAQRRHEMGVRAALGARAGNILTLVLRGSLRLALYGLILGLPAAFAVSRTLTALLYGVAPTDPRSYVASAAVLLALALVAAFGPAVRATRIDPIDALRTE